MSERPQPDLDQVRQALREHDERVEQDSEEPPAEEPPPEDAGEED